MEHFGVFMKKSEDAQPIFDEKGLRLEQRRFDAEERWRDEDRRDRLREVEENRKECKEECEARNRLELEKFKLMIDIISQKKLE